MDVARADGAGPLEGVCVTRSPARGPFSTSAAQRILRFPGYGEHKLLLLFINHDHAVESCPLWNSDYGGPRGRKPLYGVQSGLCSFSVPSQALFYAILFMKLELRSNSRSRNSKLTFHVRLAGSLNLLRCGLGRRRWDRAAALSPPDRGRSVCAHRTMCLGDAPVADGGYRKHQQPRGRRSGLQSGSSCRWRTMWSGPSTTWIGTASSRRTL